MEAASGFEPLNGGFADLSLNHLGTPPPKNNRRNAPANEASTATANGSIMRCRAILCEAQRLQCPRIYGAPCPLSRTISLTSQLPPSVP